MVIANNRMVYVFDISVRKIKNFCSKAGRVAWVLRDVDGKYRTNLIDIERNSRSGK